jgi:hypothetical protein
LCGLLVLSLVWCLISYGWGQPYRALFAVRELPALPKADLDVRHTPSGLAVYLPAEGGNCWDAPLPCTPYFDETLRLRRAPSLRSGFASELSPETQRMFWPTPRH